MLLASCSYYTERFSFSNFKPKATAARSGPPGSDIITPESMEMLEVPFLTNGTSTSLPIVYSVRVFYFTFLQWGKAAKLETQTRTRDFSRHINGEGLETGVETEAIKAITEGIAQGVVQGLKGGIP